jgi:hypothetical protein
MRLYDFKLVCDQGRETPSLTDTFPHRHFCGDRRYNAEHLLLNGHNVGFCMYDLPIKTDQHA